MDQLIFTISGGRCGSTKLWHLMDKVPTVFAEKDDDQYKFDEIRLRKLEDDTEFWRQIVDFKIAQYESTRMPNVIHTNHTPTLGFIEYFIDRGIVPNAIVLRRNPREVASSMFDLNWIPGRNITKSRYYLNPGDKNVLPLKNWKNLHNYQLCFWWCCESERRIQHYEKLFNSLGSKIWYSNLKSYLKIDHFNQMMEYFTLPTVENISQEPYNDLKHMKIEKSKNMPIELLQKMEIEVLNSIPPDFKEHLKSIGWETYE